MNQKNLMRKMLRDNRGISLMYVLGVMFLLLAVGVSVMAAASANAGFASRQFEHNRAMVLDDSVHRNILYSLQNDPADAGLLSRQLVMALYEAEASGTPLADMPLTIAFDELSATFGTFDVNTGAIRVDSVRLSFPAHNRIIMIQPPMDAIWVAADFDDAGNLIDEAGLVLSPVADDDYWIVEDALGEIIHIFYDHPDDGMLRLERAREPGMATVNVTMAVAVIIDVRGKKIASRATYEYTGGELSDDPEDEIANAYFELVPDYDDLDMQFMDSGFGEWNLIRYEKVDNINN